MSKSTQILGICIYVGPLVIGFLLAQWDNYKLSKETACSN